MRVRDFLGNFLTELSEQLQTIIELLLSTEFSEKRNISNSEDASSWLPRDVFAFVLRNHF